MTSASPSGMRNIIAERLLVSKTQIPTSTCRWKWMPVRS